MSGMKEKKQRNILVNKRQFCLINSLNDTSQVKAHYNTDGIFSAVRILLATTS